jgi:hypothetical protein
MPRLIEAPDPKENELPDLPTTDSRIEIAVLDWWEAPRWREVLDEWDIWGDPHPDVLQGLRELRKGKRMDT